MSDVRAAVISDVHGNAFALEAVLAEVRAAAPDLIINLGDQVEGDGDPARACDLQAQLAAGGAVEVRGNNEEKLWPGGRRAPLNQEFGAWLERQLPAEAVARLSALPLTATALGGELFACHGTPTSAWDSLLWMWRTSLHGYFARDPRELRPLLDPLQARVVLCGHTHRAGATRVGDTLIVNAGSVSDQGDGDPRARWTLLERRGGRWTADFRTVAYDVEAAVRWAERHASPYAALSGVLLRRGTLETRAQAYAAPAGLLGSGE